MRWKQRRAGAQELARQTENAVRVEQGGKECGQQYPVRYRTESVLRWVKRKQYWEECQWCGE